MDIIANQDETPTPDSPTPTSVPVPEVLTNNTLYQEALEQFQEQAMVLVPQSLLDFLKLLCGLLFGLLVACAFMLWQSAPKWLQGIIYSTAKESKSTARQLSNSVTTPTIGGKEMDEILLEVFEANIDTLIARMEERQRVDSLPSTKS
jgi:MFS superfamily sulfate permease-like transporter